MSSRLMFLAILVVTLTGCTSSKETTTWSNGTPPTSTLDLRALFDRATNGSIISIPYGRYVMKDGLTLNGLSGVSIVAVPGTQILVDDISADVLTIEDCGDVTLSGAFLQHLNPLKNYECHGAVLVLRNSSNVRVDNCELDGSGAIGISAWNSDQLKVTNCLIRHNSFNALYFEGCEGVKVQGNIIEENANLMQSYRSTDIEFSDNLIRNNGGYWGERRAPGLRR